MPNKNEMIPREGGADQEKFEIVAVLDRMVESLKASPSVKAFCEFSNLSPELRKKMDKIGGWKDALDIMENNSEVKLYRAIYSVDY